MKNKIQVKNKEIVLSGLAVSPGIAIGSVFIFRTLKINVHELQAEVDDPKHEWDLFNKAVKKVVRQLDSAQVASQKQYGDEFTEIFESQKTFLDDVALLEEIQQEIELSASSAPFAVSKILSEKTDYFINMENTYFRERAYDIMDLKQKLIYSLLGIDFDYNLTGPSIVVAEMLSPSDTVQFNRNFILGFLTDQGGKTSHTAIMARGLQIPAVVNGYTLSKLIVPGSTVILDGFTGTIIINPRPETIKRYRALQDDHDKFNLELQKEIALPSVTRDGQQITLMANIEFTHELSDVKKNKAEGVGLFRTESVFIEKKELPSEEEQFEIYKQAAEQITPLPLTIRTIDLGGDKFLENYSAEDELNPFLGWRAIRFCLDEPEIFKMQLRAILRASVFGNIHILLPMISSVDEVTQTKEYLEEVRQELTEKGIAFKADIPLGIMIETPAAAMLTGILADYVDYFSIGTNDLTQYVLAIDRTNDRVAKSYNTFNPAVLSFIAKTIETGRVSGKPVTLCGEYAAVSEAVPLLLGMGLRNFSMNPHLIAKVKKIIRIFDIESCEKLYEKVKELHTASAIEQYCQNFFKSKVPDLKFLS